jgi:outer membrane protein assembly factor BamB
VPPTVSGTRWILASSAGAPGTGFAANGAVTNGAVVAFKVVEQGGRFTLQPGWASRDLTSPLAPIVVNNVVFAVSSGEFRGAGNLTAAQRAQRSTAAVLYALDASTGKELWNSARTITSFARSGISAGGSNGSQIFVTTYDNTLYSFGFPIEK